MNDSRKDFLFTDDLKYYSNTLPFRICDLENYYADVVLSDDLKEIYAEVQKNCEDFRSNVFLKNLEVIEENLVKI